MAEQRIKFLVTGSVQGVNFRWSTAKSARALGVTGHIQNDPDGSVSGEAQGSQEKIQDFIKVLKKGPPAATVETVKTDDVTAKEGEEGFRALG